MKKVTIIIVVLISGIIAFLYWFRGTPESEVPYPDFKTAKKGKSKGYEKRPIPYHEIFLGWRNWTDYHFVIYNDLNDVLTPAEWSDLKAREDEIKENSGCDIVVFNGPRFWVLDKIESNKKTSPLGSILGHEMLIPAFFSLTIKQIKDRRPYHPLTMNRNTKYTYFANDYIYKLIAPDGTEYIMQAASQEIDPNMQLKDLVNLGSRLKNLPEGWRYEPEFIKEEFINISDGNTRIVQDEFRNTYQIRKK